MNVKDNSDVKNEGQEGILSEENMPGINFRDYYVVSREFVAEKEKGVGVLEGLSEDVFNGLFSIGVKSIEKSVDDIKNNFDLDSITEEIESEKSVVKNLEEDMGISKKVAEVKSGSDFYKAVADVSPFKGDSAGLGNLYNEKKYDEGKSSEEFYDELINEGKVEGFVSPEDKRGVKRSILEVAGFRDEEAEKKREEMRRFRMGV